MTGVVLTHRRLASALREAVAASDAFSEVRPGDPEDRPATARVVGDGDLAIGVVGDESPRNRDIAARVRAAEPGAAVAACTADDWFLHDPAPAYLDRRESGAADMLDAARRARDGPVGDARGRVVGAIRAHGAAVRPRYRDLAAAARERDPDFAARLDTWARRGDRGDDPIRAASRRHAHLVAAACLAEAAGRPVPDPVEPFAAFPEDAHTRHARAELRAALQAAPARALDRDPLGPVYGECLPREERRARGQFATPPRLLLRGRTGRGSTAGNRRRRPALRVRRRGREPPIPPRGGLRRRGLPAAPGGVRPRGRDALARRRGPDRAARRRLRLLSHPRHPVPPRGRPAGVRPPDEVARERLRRRPPAVPVRQVSSPRGRPDRRPRLRGRTCGHGAPARRAPRGSRRRLRSVRPRGRRGGARGHRLGGRRLRRPGRRRDRLDGGGDADGRPPPVGARPRQPRALPRRPRRPSRRPRRAGGGAPLGPRGGLAGRRDRRERLLLRLARGNRGARHREAVPPARAQERARPRLAGASDAGRYLLDIHGYVSELDDPGNAKRALRRDAPGLAAYVDRGEREGHHEGSTCRSRRVWFDLGDLDIPDVFVPKLLRERVFAVRNLAGAAASNAIDCVSAREGVDPDALAAVLNSSLSRAAMEVWGRDEAGMLQLMTYETASLPVPDPRALDPGEREAIVAAEGAERDRAVCAALDIGLDAGRLRSIRERLLRRRVGEDTPARAE